MPFNIFTTIAEWTNLKDLGAVFGHLLGEALELFDALTEVRDPLDDGEP